MSGGANRHSTLRDAQIVADLRQGHEAGVDGLLAQYHAPLLAYAFRLLGDRQAAEDAVQEAFVRFLDHLDNLHNPGKLRSYLYQVVTHCCRDHQRRPQRRETLMDTPWQKAASETVEGEVVNRTYVSALLKELSPLHAEVLILRFYEDMELDAIAGILELPVGTVKSRLYYALNRLRILMEAETSRSKAGVFAHEQ